MKIQTVERPNYHIFDIVPEYKIRKQRLVIVNRPQSWAFLIRWRDFSYWENTQGYRIENVSKNIRQ